jgi:hypothetical protein
MPWKVSERKRQQLHRRIIMVFARKKRAKFIKKKKQSS